MTTETLTQTLLLPNFPRTELARCLSPNGRAHWAAKVRAKGYVFSSVKLRAAAAGFRRMTGRVVMQPVFTFPDHRKRDDDNLATGVMKAVRDCLVREHYIEADDTDHLRQLPVEVCVVNGVRSLELRFEVQP